MAKELGLAPSTLVFLFIVLNVVARAVTRAIPDDATGWQGFVRQLTAIVAVEVSPRITSGVTVAKVAQAALANPTIAAHVAADAPKDESVK